MKNEFAKLFEIEDHQILIMKDETEDGYEIKQIVDFEEVRPIMSIGFDSEEKCNECFNKYGKEEAEKFYNVISNMLNPTEN
jgi:hypothetical protein